MKIRTNLSRIEFDSPVLGRSWIPVRACELSMMPIYQEQNGLNFPVTGPIKARLAKFVALAKCAATLIVLPGETGYAVAIPLGIHDIDPDFRASMRRTHMPSGAVTRKIVKQAIRSDGAVFNFDIRAKNLEATWRRK